MALTGVLCPDSLCWQLVVWQYFVDVAYSGTPLVCFWIIGLTRNQMFGPPCAPSRSSSTEVEVCGWLIWSTVFCQVGCCVLLVWSLALMVESFLQWLAWLSDSDESLLVQFLLLGLRQLCRRLCYVISLPRRCCSCLCGEMFLEYKRCC